MGGDYLSFHKVSDGNFGSSSATDGQGISASFFSILST
jgi:hypothetical protein